MTVLLQDNEVGRFDSESSLIYQHCIMERIPSQKFHYQDMIDGNVDLSGCSLVVGGVPAVTSALKQLGLDIPKPNYYPEELSQFLHRDVWIGEVKDVYGYLAQETKIFAKSVNWKQMTGRVFSHDDSLGKLSTLSDDTPLWLSSVVGWNSEWRVYVSNHQIKAICIYEGSDEIKPNIKTIQSAIDILSNIDKHSKFYTFDWGVLTTGETALIESNDAWAIGAYKGIHYRDYYELLKGRWDEIISNGEG